MHPVASLNPSISDLPTYNDDFCEWSSFEVEVEKVQHTNEGYSLSPQQARLWLLQQQCNAYRAYYTVMIEGALDVGALRRAVEAVLWRHDIFRTTFYRLPGMGLPMQVINDQLLYSWQQISLTTGPEQQEKSDRLLLEVQNYPLNLEEEPLLRCSLLTLAEQQHVLCVCTSALHADMHTLAQFMQEVSTLYGKSSTEVDEAQEEELNQYVQFSEWQNSLLEEEEGKAYWSEQSGASSTLLRLPYERKREMPVHFHPRTVGVDIAPALQKQIEALCTEQRCTLPVFFFACWQALLWRFVNQNDLLCGINTTSRIYDELRDIAGPLAKYIPLHCHPEKRQRFCDFLGTIQTKYEAHLEQQLYFALEDPDGSRQYPFGFDYYEIPAVTTTGGISFVPRQCYVCSEPFKVRLIVQEYPGAAPMLTLEYNSELYTAQDIQRLAEQLLLVLNDAAIRPESMLDELEILGTAERELVLRSYNQTNTAYPQEMCLHQLFERQAERTPDAIAVVDEGQQVTYHALNRLSHQLAAYLQTQAIGPEVLVGLYLERSVALVIAILGVLKAGAAYVPLDLTTPQPRLRFIASDAHLRMVLTSESLQSRLEEWPEQVPIVALESINEHLVQNQALSPLAYHPTASNLAYVIYTSGSTGEPRGVMIPHQGVAHYVHWCSQHYNVASGRGSLVHSPVSFDLTVTALFAPLAVGWTAWLLKQEKELDELVAMLQQTGQWSLLKLTPAHLNLLNQMLEPHELADRSGALILGGEALKGDQIRPWVREAPQTRIVNEYGPTETVVGCCIYEVAPDEEIEEQVPIGHPIANTRCYVLDERGLPVPIGIIGELYIGGVGLGRGYIGRADLTAERFLPDPYSSVPGSRMYRTGDLARYKNQQGILEYLGRIDRQVKLRGYRVELGDIEATLSLHEMVRDCVVDVYETPGRDKSLAAYVVSERNTTPDPSMFRSYLSSRLPAYMLPDSYIFLDTLPLTANGKVNRALLPSPEGNVRSVDRVPEDINAVVPRDMLEFQLLQIWEEILPTRPIFITDSFFELGGHSILAVSLMAKIRKRLGIDLPLAILFDHRTIADLAVVTRQQSSIPEPPALVAIQPEGTKPPLFCIHPAGGTVFCYTNLARHLGTDQPFYGLQMPDFISEGETCVSLEKMAARYVAEIQAVRPQGPYLLGGWSSGGLMAFEIAQQLRRRNQEVGLLALMDTVLPYAYRQPDARIEELDTSDAAMVKEIISRRSFSVREDISALPPEEQLRSVLEEGKKAHFIPADTDLDQFRCLRRIHLMNLHAIKSYVPEIYAGQIDIFRAVESLIPDEVKEIPDVLPLNWTLTGGWEELTTKEVAVHEIPGNHKQMMSEPNVQFVATALKNRLEQVASSVV